METVLLLGQVKVDFVNLIRSWVVGFFTIGISIYMFEVVLFVCWYFGLLRVGSWDERSSRTVTCHSFKVLWEIYQVDRS